MSSSSHPFAGTDLFEGGGEAAQLLRQVDWLAHPMGSPDTWPQSLRTSLSLCLTSRYPICILWGKQRIYFYNDAYAPIVGAKHPRALSRPYPEVWPEIWETDIRPLIEGVERTGQASWSENILLVLQRFGFNEECYFQFSFAPIRIEGDAVRGAFTTITETTPQIVDARRLKTLSALGAKTGSAASVADAFRIAGEVIARNGHDIPFALFFRHVAGEGNRLEQTIGLTGDGPWCDPAAWGLAQGDSVNERWIEEPSDQLGELRAGPWPERIARVAVLPLQRADGPQPYGYVIAGISPRRPLDEAYRSFLRLVANQCATAAANSTALEAERERARKLAELDRAKTAFFSNVSHEFRTPLTLMLGSLEEELATTTDAAARERLTVAHRNSLRLLKLVNTLLDFSQLEAGRATAHFVPTDLAALTVDLASIFQSAVRKAGLELVVDCEATPEPVHVDPAMWEKIVLNLLGNALKFTFSGVIRVGLRVEKGVAALAVSDTGGGIPPEELPRIFDRFHRVQGAKSRTHEGTGIGLSLVRELAQLHGGTATAESVPGEGTTVTVTVKLGTAHLPAGHFEPARSAADRSLARLYVSEVDSVLSAAEDAPHAAAARHGADAAMPLVLVVDDNAEMRSYVARLLQRHYRVELTANGLEAWAAIERVLPDLVVSDIMMPECDGLGLLRRIRSSPRTSSLPVLLLSARAGAESTSTGLEAGADDYVVKPFTATELLARVRAHLNLAAARRRAACAVAESESRLRSIIEQSAAGVIQVDQRGRIVLANARWCQMFGYSAEELASLDVAKLVPPERMDEALERRDRMLSGGPDLLVEREYLRKDGSSIWVQTQSSALRDDAGNVIGIVAVMLDQSVRKGAERRAALLASLAEKLAVVSDEREIVALAVETVGRALQAHRCYFVECIAGENRVILGRNWVRDEAANLEGEFRLFDFGGEDWWRRYSAGDFAVTDVCLDPLTRDSAQNYLAVNIRSYAVQPFRQQGGCSVVLAVTEQVPRVWSADDLGLIDHVAARVWPLVERARAEKARRESDLRFRATFNQASTILALLDLAGTTTALNEAALTVGAHGSGPVKGQPFWQLGWWKDLPDVQMALRSAIAAAAEKPVRFDTVYRGPSGAERWMDVTFSAVRSGDGVGFILVEGHEITELRQARAALEVARDLAVEASQAKDSFLAALSHELRTPLSPVLMVASDGSTNPELAPEVRSQFDLIRKNIELEARLIDDLLDLTRITRGKLSIEKREIDAHAAVLEAIGIVQPDVAEKRITPSLNLKARNTHIDADPVRFQQILWNILRNAAKFTPAGGEIVVQTLNDAAGNFCVQVSDTGIGMTPSELERLFENFAQGDHANSGLRQFGGLGLGLAISQRLAVMHGGRIEATSPGRGQGSTFTVRLPARVRGRVKVVPVPGGAAGADSASPLAGSGLRILLVEDHESTRRTLTKILERRGHRVTPAGTVDEGVAALNLEKFELLVSDVGLPDGDGFQLMEQALKIQPCIAGIALSGYGMEHDLQRSSNVGFVDHLVKPVSIPTLDAAIARAAARIGVGSAGLSCPP